MSIASAPATIGVVSPTSQLATISPIAVPSVAIERIGTTARCTTRDAMSAIIRITVAPPSTVSSGANPVQSISGLVNLPISAAAR